MAAFGSLDLALVEREILSRLDLPSALSLSLTSKLLLTLNQSTTSILGIHIRKSFINDTHPVKKIFLELIRRGYDNLLKEFLALRFRGPLRSLPDPDFIEILAEALSHSRGDIFKLILGITKRRILFSRELIVALGKSGSIQLIKDLLDYYCVTDPTLIIPHLLDGASSGGKVEVIEWLQSEFGGGKPLGFVYLMITKAAIGGTNYIMSDSMLFNRTCPNYVDILCSFLPFPQSHFVVQASVSLIRTNTGNWNVLEWVRTHCSSDPAFEEAFNEAPIFALAAENGIDVIKHFYEITREIPFDVVGFAAKFGNVEALEWAFSVGANYNASDVICYSLEHGRIPFLQRFMDLIPNETEISTDGFLIAAVKSMDLSVVTWAISRFNLDVASVDTIELNDTFFQNYAGRPEHEELWKFLVNHGMKFDVKKYLDFLAENGESQSIFERSSNLFIRTRDSIDFVLSLRFKFTVEDIINSLNEFSVDALVRLREVVPEAFINAEPFLDAAFSSNRLSLIKYGASIYPSEVVLDVTKGKVYDILFEGSLHILDWIYKTFPRNINWSRLFDHFMKSEDLSLGISHLNGIQWLIDHGVKLSPELYITAIEEKAHVSFFMLLVDNKCPRPPNLAEVLATSEFSHDEKARIQRVLERGKV